MLIVGDGRRIAVLAWNEEDMRREMEKRKR